MSTISDVSLQLADIARPLCTHENMVVNEDSLSDRIWLGSDQAHTSHQAQYVEQMPF